MGEKRRSPKDFALIRGKGEKCEKAIKKLKERGD